MTMTIKKKTMSSVQDGIIISARETLYALNPICFPNSVSDDDDDDADHHNDYNGTAVVDDADLDDAC